jgi:ABC-type phosphate/phosphonate transport system substrate-binding protein
MSFAATPSVCRSRTRRRSRWRLGRTLFLTLTVLAGLQAEPPAAPATTDTSFRLGISAEFMQGVSEPDARAAMKIWAETLARESGIVAHPEARLFANVGEIVDALRTRQVDVVGMTTAQYLAVTRQVPVSDLFSQDPAARASYLLLVRSDAPRSTLADLRGCRLLEFRHAHTSMASVWLEVLLAREHLPGPDQFFGTVTAVSKLPATVLPVFFRKADACLVDRAGFETMAEMNPQLRKQLRIIAASPAINEGLCCFRADFDSPVKQTILEGIPRFNASLVGQQILTVFQSRCLQVLSETMLDSARELWAEHERLLPPAGNGSRPADGSPGEPSRTP